MNPKIFFLFPRTRRIFGSEISYGLEFSDLGAINQLRVSCSMNNCSCSMNGAVCWTLGITGKGKGMNCKSWNICSAQVYILYRDAVPMAFEYERKKLKFCWNYKQSRNFNMKTILNYYECQIIIWKPFWIVMSVRSLIVHDLWKSTQ